MNNILYIINPAGNGGAALKAWESFKACCKEPTDPECVAFTNHPGHARELAAGGNGYDVIVAAGGDGTVGEVICGIMDGREPRPRLAVIPCGTGNDVAQNAGIFSITDAATALQEGSARAFDLIRIDRQGEQRHAFLFANVGFSSIPKMKPWMKRLLGSTGAYNLATLLQIIAYRAPHMRVQVDGREHAGKTFMVIAGNAEYAAGGCMRICPGASTDDGELNINIIKSASIYRVVTRFLAGIAKGTHINEPEISYFTGRNIEVQSEPPALLDIDGELFGTTPATITVCPRALNIVCNQNGKPANGGSP